ncbi:unnamed protein product, partial [Iphiclides podalirius]
MNESARGTERGRLPPFQQLACGYTDRCARAVRPRVAAARWRWMVEARSRRRPPRAPRAHLPRRARGAAARRGEARRARPAAAAPRTTRARRPARGQRARRGPGPPRDRNTRTVELRTGERAPHSVIRAASRRLAGRRGCARAATRRLGRRTRRHTTAPEHYFGSDAPRRRRRPPAACCQFYAKLRAGGDAICAVGRPGVADGADVVPNGGRLLIEWAQGERTRVTTCAAPHSK